MNNVTRAKLEGFQQTGSCSRGSWDRDVLLPRLDELKKELKPYGGTAKILKVVDRYPFRGEEKNHTYWAIFAKYTPEYWAHVNAEKVERNWQSRKEELRKFVEALTPEEAMVVEGLLKLKG